jgi:hypothetical protein
MRPKKVFLRAARFRSLLFEAFDSDGSSVSTVADTFRPLAD